MLSILGISIRDKLSNIVPWQDNISMFCRVFTGIILGTMSFIALIATANEEDTRGANFNASGVACLLGLAEIFSEQPLKDIEIHFVFSGAYQCWMSGLRHFLKKNPLPKKETLFINIEGVGSGDLHIISQERMIFTFHVDKEIMQFIDKHHLSLKIQKADCLPLPTASYILTSHGYKGFTIMGLDKDKKPICCNQIEDTTLNIDEQKIYNTSEMISRFVMLWTEEKK
ncbi:MAG: M28 family peptidase [Candidatus Hydrogenedens sp.]